MRDNSENLDQESLLAQENFQGKLLYSYHSLIHDLKKIDVLRENTLYHRNGFIEVRENQIYSEEITKRISGNLYTTKDFVRLFGRKASRVFEILKKEGYVESFRGKIRIRSLFKVTTEEEFRFNEVPHWKDTVYQALQSLLIKRYPVDMENPSEIVDMLFSRKMKKLPATRNSSLNYLFRMGNSLISVDFTQPPSIELLELVRLRLEMVFEENMVNFFQIVSSYASDESIWRQKKNKKEIFFNIMNGLLENTWRLFDLEECRIRIKGGTDLYSFCNGSLIYRADTNGEGSYETGDSLDFPEKLKDSHREYLMNSMQLVINRDNLDPVTMDLYMKSRSLHNLNPRQNHQHHRFILLLIQHLGKSIEQAIPVLKAEEMEKHLKWRSFLDRSRIRSMGWGEDLFRIIVDSVGILKVFFHIQEAAFHIPDSEMRKMLDIYSRNHPHIQKNFTLLEQEPQEVEIFSQSMIPIRLLEAIDEEMTLWLTLPLDPEVVRLEEKDYLEGSDLIPWIQKIARSLDLKLPRDRLYFLIKNCLNSNPMLTMANMVEFWPEKNSTVPGQHHRLTQFASRLVDSSSLFFDVIQSMDNHIEAGITNMRGSRDRLTGLYNRQRFNSKLDQFFNDKQPFGLMFIDMDTFKIYNDAISHSFGDRLLRGLAERMLQISGELQGLSVPGRFGGDEFCFALAGVDQTTFEKAASRVFRHITGSAETVRFSFEERPGNRDWEVNAISFLHRLLRPDVGGARGAAVGFVEPKGSSPRERLLKIYTIYMKEENRDDGSWLEKILLKGRLDEEEVQDISRYLVRILLEKIKNNRMFQQTEELFQEALVLFIQGQLQDKSTTTIRENIRDFLGKSYLELNLNYKISAGLAHTDEDRLRSVSSLFKAADGRAYIAKHNGRNGLFGLDNQRLI